MKKYKLIIFDWDGTLADSRQSIVKCVQRTAEDIGFPIPTSGKISSGIGLSISAQMERLFPQMEHGKFINCFRKNYDIYKDVVVLFRIPNADGIFQVVDLPLRGRMGDDLEIVIAAFR